jgi:acyl carrier protein
MSSVAAGRSASSRTCSVRSGSGCPIKLRGFRIEAGEIENALRAHAGVRDAVVIAREDVPGDQRLVAYVIAHAAPPTPDELREHLRPVLPEYMIPSAFVPLAALPLTGNGKLDRAALPAPAAAPRATEAEPRTDVEATIAAIWAELLGVDDVELDQDFFSAGGHSLLLTQLAVRVRQALGVELPLRTLFDSPSVRGVAATIEEELARADQLLAEIEAMSPEEVEALLAESDK